MGLLGDTDRVWIFMFIEREIIAPALRNWCEAAMVRIDIWEMTSEMTANR